MTKKKKKKYSSLQLFYNKKGLYFSLEYTLTMSIRLMKTVILYLILVKILHKNTTQTYFLCKNYSFEFQN